MSAAAPNDAEPGRVSSWARGGGAPWWAALLALTFVVALRLAYINGDGLLYIAHGRFILDGGALPAVDPFSEMSVRTPLVLHLLLPMIGFAVVERAGGLCALVLLAAVAGVAVLAGFLLPARRSFVATLAGAGVLASLLGVDHQFFEARAQVLAFLPFVAWLALCRRALDSDRAPLSAAHLAAAFVVAALWANTHPSFLVAVALPLLFAGGVALEPRPARAALRPLLLLSAVGLCASWVSPYGGHLDADVVRLLFDETTSRIEHMRSPGVTAGWLLFFALTVSIAVARAVTGERRQRRVDLVVAFVWIAMTLISRRYAAFVAAWSIVLLPKVLAGVRLPPRVARAAVLASGVAAVVAIPLVPAPLDVDRSLPVAAASVLDTLHPPPRLLNEFAWGGYLMYRFGTRAGVFVDGRNNLYHNGVFDDYLHMAYAGPRLDELLDTYDIRTVFWTAGWRLDRALASRPAWRQVYRDEKAVIYVRR